MTASAGDTFSSSSVAAQKSALRSRMRAMRKAVPISYRRLAAQRAAHHALPVLRRMRRVAVYLSARSELSTAALVRRLLRRGVGVYVPLTFGEGRMRFVPLRPQTVLRRGALGLLQPASSRGACPLRRLDAVILPLLAFDAQGRRLGNGGGYYDRAFGRFGPSTTRRPLRIGHAYAQQEVAAIADEPWDVRLHAVVTERGVRRFPFPPPRSA